MDASSRLDSAWKYFDLHAKQRISLFNFFVLFSGLLTTGFVAALKEPRVTVWLPVGIGVLQVLTSYIFYRLDERNKALTRHAEQAIVELERSIVANDSEPRARLFTSEPDMTQASRSIRPRTIGESFRWLFVIFTLFGGMEVWMAARMLFTCH